MKVLMSAYACSPFKGSEPGIGWNWCYHVARAGYEVYCITTFEGKPDIEKKLEETPISNLTFIYLDVPNWVHRAYSFQAGVYFHYFYWQHLAYNKAKELDRELNFDLVHHVTYGSLQFGSELWKLNKPFIFGPCGGGQFALPSLKKYFGKFWRQEIIRKWIGTLLVTFNRNTRKTIQRSYLFVASNQETRDMAVRTGAKNVVFMNDSFATDMLLEKEYTPRTPSPHLRILWAGRLYPRKGLNLVLEVLGQLKEVIPFRLTILGDGPLNNELPKWIAANGLEAYIDWRGQVPFTEVKKAYLSHDLFFFTSLRDTGPTQLLESLANGLPVLSLNMHGAQTIIPDNGGIKVQPGSPAETIGGLKNAIENLYQHPEQLEAMGRNGLAYAHTQKWETKIKVVTAVYDEIAKQ